MSQSQGRPLRLSHADIVRWRAQLLVTGTCHVWMGAVGSDGYGRIAIRNAEDGARTLTPHQVGARLGYGPIPAGATVLHDCEVRLCCRAAPGHLRVGTQSENMRQAVARGRAVGPHPGRVDVRGKAGASRAIQAALRDATGRSPSALAAVPAAVIADGDPLRDLHPLFDLPAYPRATTGRRGQRGPGRGGAGVAAAPGAGRVVAAVRRVIRCAAAGRMRCSPLRGQDDRSGFPTSRCGVIAIRWTAGTRLGGAVRPACGPAPGTRAARPTVPTTGNAAGHEPGSGTDR